VYLPRKGIVGATSKKLRRGDKKKKKGAQSTGVIEGKKKTCKHRTSLIPPKTESRQNVSR